MDAVWGDEGVGRRMGVLDGVEIVEGKGSFEGKCVTNGDFVALLFSAVRRGDADLLKLLWDFLFTRVTLRSMCFSLMSVCLFVRRQKRDLNG